MLGNVGVSKGSLHQSSASGERASGSRRYPAGLAFVRRCSKWSVRWQLILFFSKCEYELTASCTLLCILSSARGFSALSIFISWNWRRSVTFWPQRATFGLLSLGLSSKISFATQRCRSNCRIPKHCSDLCWLYGGPQAGELRCPEKVTKCGRHCGVWV